MHVVIGHLSVRKHKVMKLCKAAHLTAVSEGCCAILEIVTLFHQVRIRRHDEGVKLRELVKGKVFDHGDLFGSFEADFLYPWSFAKSTGPDGFASCRDDKNTRVLDGFVERIVDSDDLISVPLIDRLPVITVHIDRRRLGLARLAIITIIIVIIVTGVIAIGSVISGTVISDDAVIRVILFIDLLDGIIILPVLFLRLLGIVILVLEEDDARNRSGDYSKTYTTDN